MNTDSIPHLTHAQYAKLLRAIYGNPSLILCTVRTDTGMTLTPPPGMNAIGWRHYSRNQDGPVYHEDAKEILFIKGA